MEVGGSKYGIRWKSTEAGGNRYGSKDASPWKSVEMDMGVRGNQWNSVKVFLAVEVGGKAWKLWM